MRVLLQFIALLSSCLFSLESIGQDQSTSTLVLHIDNYNIESDSLLSYRLIDYGSKEQILINEIVVAGNAVVQSHSIDPHLCYAFVFDRELSINTAIKISIDDSLLIDTTLIDDTFQFTVNCNQGTNCENPVRLRSQSVRLPEGDNFWYYVRPYVDTYYNLKTESDCDTEIWIYDNCQNIATNDITGSIVYNAAIDGGDAGFNQFLFERDQRYYIRIRKNCNTSVNFIAEDLKLRKGCMDPLSCNFDPLANLDSEDCYYSTCNPDLIVNQEVLLESIHLDQINNDSECLLVEGCLSGYGTRDIIRFSTQIENIGDADFIVGEPIEESPLFSADNCHNHWHYLGYAEYLLFDSTSTALPVGIKNGFCALDFSCDSELSYKYNCDYMGISAGCSDTYDSDLLCQWIDVTDVPDGNYTLVVRVNYDRSPDLFDRRESDYNNNWAQVGVSIDRSNDRVELSILEDWDAYTDCLGIVYGDTERDCQGVCGGLSHYGDLSSDNRVDGDDLSLYLDYVDSDYFPGDMSCYDLSGDSFITIHDYLLFANCLDYNSRLDENDPLHTHCEFPYSVDNQFDSVNVIIDEDFNNVSIQLLYKSTDDLTSLSLTYSGMDIDSIESDYRIDYIIRDTNLILYSSDSLLISSSIDYRPLAKLFFSDAEESICVDSLYEVTNARMERIINRDGQSCIDLMTTSVVPLTENISRFEVFPNPIQQYASLSIELSDELITDQLSLSIYSIDGQRLMHQTFNRPSKTITLSTMAINSGVYIVELQNAQFRSTQKLVITSI